VSSVEAIAAENGPAAETLTAPPEQAPVLHTPTGDTAGRRALGDNGVAATACDHAGAANGAATTPRSGPIVWPGQQQARRRERLGHRLEVFFARLSNRNNFWRRVCSLVWLPYAFRSGIRVKRLSERTFTAVLPFRRFNRNWYNAMAGAALLANSEIAGGTYVFGVCEGRRRVVCKKLSYSFLRPCLGPAVYEVTPEQEIAPLLARGGPFNIDVRIDVKQQLGRPGKEKRVGRCFATFHVAPIEDRQERRARRSKRRSRAKARRLRSPS